MTLYARAGQAGRPNFIVWRVVAVPKGERELTQDGLKAQIRDIVRRHMPNAEISISDPGIVEGARDYPIQLNVVGEDLEEISRVAEHYADIFRRMPGTQDVDTQYTPGSPELAIHVNRDRASQLGIPLALVAMTARASIEGDVAGLYRDTQLDDEVDIRVRLQESDRNNAGACREPPQSPTPGGIIPLSDFASVGRTEGPLGDSALQPSARHHGDGLAEWSSALGHRHRVQRDHRLRCANEHAHGLARPGADDERVEREHDSLRCSSASSSSTSCSRRSSRASCTPRRS